MRPRSRSGPAPALARGGGITTKIYDAFSHSGLPPDRLKTAGPVARRAQRGRRRRLQRPLVRVLTALLLEPEERLRRRAGSDLPVRARPAALLEVSPSVRQGHRGIHMRRPD